MIRGRGEKGTKKNMKDDKKKTKNQEKYEQLLRGVKKRKLNEWEIDQEGMRRGKKKKI